MFRKIIITLLAAVPFLTQAQEVEFQRNIPWKDALKIAKEENKYIFVDAYTDWCYWCKVMDQKTFTNEKVIQMLDDNFVSVKIDAEKGEGIAFAAKFKITGYPTVLFFTPEGMLLKKQPGYLDVETFMSTSQAVLEGTEKPTIDGKDLNPEFPEFYTQTFDPKVKEKPSTEEVYAFLDKQKDITSEVSWAVMYRFPLNEKYEQLFLGKKDSYIELYGKDEVNGKIERMVSVRLQNAIKQNSEKEMTKTVMFIKEHFDSELAETAAENVQKQFYQQTGQWQKLAELVNETYENDHPSMINSIAWDIYEKCDNKDVINMACEWMALAAEKDPSYPVLDTYAAVLYKAGRYSEAKEWAEKAIAQGKEDEQKVDGTVELMKKIEEAQKK